MKVETFDDLALMVGQKRAAELWEKVEPQKKISKYRNVKTDLDGIKFDSIAEAHYYATLKMLKKSGIVKGFQLQPVFELIPKFKLPSGKNIAAQNYRADFKVYYPNGTVEVVDVKGKATAHYKDKRKAFLYRYAKNYKFVEIINGERVEW